MHQHSLNLMSEFVERFDLAEKTVLDMGSYDLNGSYRQLFKGGKYIGADITAGPNVDVIVGHYEWTKIRDVDAVICGQVMEHVHEDHAPKFFADMFGVLRPGGLLCLIVPSNGPAHSHPIWSGYWPPERLIPIAMAAGFEVIECQIHPMLPFDDVRLIARKPEPRAKKGKGADADNE